MFLLVSSSYSFVSFLLFSLITYFILFSFSSLSSLVYYIYILDEWFLFMVLITFLVLITAYLDSDGSNSLYFIFSFTFMACLLVFSSFNLFLIYLGYELSIIPIILMITVNGLYPDRVSAALYLLVYTSFFALPFSFSLFSIFDVSSSLMLLFSVGLIRFSPFLSTLIFFTFAVNLPVYGLHYWLPLAHVEAPTAGSIILAGVLLNLGGVGLIRFSPFLSTSFLLTFFSSYLLFFLALVVFICFAQSDFNRLVAYSSVSHMMTIPLIILCSTSFSFNAILMVMVFHGLSSPLLFSLVGLSYSLFNTRILSISRGLLVLSPIVSFIMAIAFFLTISAPPTPAFLGEVFFTVSVFNTYSLSFIPLTLFLLGSLVYNLSWLSSVVFSSSTPSINLVNYVLSNGLLSQFILLVLSLPLLLLE